MEKKSIIRNEVVPFTVDIDIKKGKVLNDKLKIKNINDLFDIHLSGQVAGGINQILPAKQIVDEMINEAIKVIKEGNKLIIPYKLTSKL